MSIGVKKAVVGFGIGLVGVLLVFPVAFWFLTVAVDQSLGFRSILGRPFSQILAAACALTGVFWVTWAYSYLLFVGQGLPLELFGKALHPTQVLVTTGPYAYSRNPVVVGVVLILLGVALLRGSVAGLILAPVAALAAAAYVIVFEEKGLRRRFGADYEEYRRNVPLLIPRLSPYLHAATGA